MHSLRICLFAGTFLPRIGGSELSLHYLARGFQQRGHLPVVLAPTIQGDIRPWKIDYPVHRFPRARPVFLMLEKLRRDFDILYVNGIYSAGYYAAKLRGFLNVPIVVSCPGGDLQVIPEIGHGFRLDARVDRRIRWAVHHVDALFAIVPSLRRTLESLGAPSDRIWDVPHGSDPSRFQNVPSIRSLLPIPQDCRIVILIGRNDPQKGYADMVRAVPRIVAEYPQVRIVIVGRDTNKLQPLVDELGVEEHVILSPPFTWDEYPSLLVGSDVYASSSLAEGFSLALADAMTVGIPQAVFNVEGCRDVVKHEQTGLVVEPRDPQVFADAVVRLLKDDSLRIRLAEGSRAAARQFTWDKIVDRHLEIYQRLINQRLRKE